MSITTKPRSNLTDLQSLLSLPPFGAEGGYQTEGDILVQVTADGVSLETIWREVADVIKAWNAERTALTNLLTFSTTNTADAIPQSRSADSFDLASEYGEPTAMKPPSDYHLMGYDFRDYDKASRWTRFFLRDSTAEQVRAVANYALEADNRLTTGTILQRLFDPTEGENNYGASVYGLYNGDTMVPPAYLGKDFVAPHQHYLVSESDVIDSGDLEIAVRKVTEHGYGMDANSRLLVLMNPAQAEVVSTFKAGVANGTGGALAKHSYIPSAGAPAYLQPDNIVGQVAPESYNGLAVQGSYGNTWIIQSDFIPDGWFAVCATYGPNSQDNVIGFREHVQPLYRGFRSIGGPGTYPIADAFFTRAFGVGVRRRGQACVTQVKSAGSYDIPVLPK